MTAMYPYEYLKDPLDRHEIVALSKALGQHPSEFVRRKEANFMDATGNCDDFSVEEWSEIFRTPPQLNRTSHTYFKWQGRCWAPHRRPSKLLGRLATARRRNSKLACQFRYIRMDHLIG